MRSALANLKFFQVCFEFFNNAINEILRLCLLLKTYNRLEKMSNLEGQTT